MGRGNTERRERRDPGAVKQCVQRGNGEAGGGGMRKGKEKKKKGGRRRGRKGGRGSTSLRRGQFFVPETLSCSSRPLPQLALAAVQRTVTPESQAVGRGSPLGIPPPPPRSAQSHRRPCKRAASEGKVGTPLCHSERVIQICSIDVSRLLGRTFYQSLQN